MIPDPNGVAFKRADQYLRKHIRKARELDSRIEALMNQDRYGMLAA